MLILFSRVASQESLWNRRNLDDGAEAFATHAGVGLCDCNCDGQDCKAATCNATKWTATCVNVGSDQDNIYETQCRRQIFNKRRKRNAEQHMNDYSDNLRLPFSLDEPELNKVYTFSFNFNHVHQRQAQIIRRHRINTDQQQIVIDISSCRRFMLKTGAMTEL